ncbi:MAG: PQQ-binding-like beta-propeller repeat protein [Armatimonadetes bacterium]|nr:PQQ-binding-like beta-propeller repeat protein [Armatimonadota bacterium]
MRAISVGCLLCLAYVLPAARGAELDRIDRMVAAAVVPVKGGAASGYGLVCSTGALVAVPAALLGEQQKPVFSAGGQSYTPTETHTDPRGYALCHVPLDPAYTAALGSTDMVPAGAVVRVLRPDGDGFARVECKVVSNDSRRVGRIRFRVIELDLPPLGLPLGLPVYLPSDGRVVGLLGVQGEIASGLGSQASAVDVVAGLIFGAGLQIKLNPFTESGGVVDAEGRLVERFVSRWLFPASTGTISADLRRSGMFWQKAYGRFPDQLSQPVVDQGHAFFGDCYGQVYSLDLAQQRRSWISSASEYWIRHPPLVGADTVCVVGGLLWPARKSSAQNLLLQREMFSLHDALGGPLMEISQLWRKRYGGSLWANSDPWLLFALYGAGAVVGLERSTGRARWGLPVSFCDRLLELDDCVIFAGLGLRGRVAMADGKLLWASGDGYAKSDREHNTWWHAIAVDSKRLLCLAVPLRYTDDGTVTRTTGGARIYNDPTSPMWQFFGVRVEMDTVTETLNARLVTDGPCMVVECDPQSGAKRREWNLTAAGFPAKSKEHPLVTHTVLEAPGTPQEVLYAVVGKVLTRFVPATGACTVLRDLSDDPDATSFATQLTVRDNVVYVGTTRRELLALDAITGKPVWPKTPVLRGWVGSPLVLGGVVYVGTADGYLHAFATADGRELWWYEVGGRVVGQPVPVQEGDRDLLYCTLDNGNFVSVELPTL